MFLPKKEGGLGIRNFDVFNRALLAKQAWRVLTMPDSLMAKVLKGKYFPTTSFLDAKQNQNMSFTWRSIIAVKDIVEKGVSRVIGNGRDTRIWRDPWIPNIQLPAVRQEEGPISGDEPYYVSDLITENNWDNAKLDKFFTPWVAQVIRKIPLHLHDMRDSWTWKHTQHGGFSVRSAYYVELMAARKHKPSASTVMKEPEWKWICDANIQPKVKMFGWKSMHNGIPLRQNLARRGMEVDKVCPRCGEEEESIEHLLIQCAVSQRVWYSSPLRIHVARTGGIRFRDWVISVGGNKKEEEWWMMFWMICWNIWLGRNAWVFEGKWRDEREMLERVRRGVMECVMQNDGKGKEMNQRASKCRWTAPPEGMYKLNSDAAMFEESQIGMGGVVRDYVWDVVVAVCEKRFGSDNVAVAEALSARQGLKVPWRLGFET